MDDITFDKICDECFSLAIDAKSKNQKYTEEMDVFDLSDLYINLILEKYEKEYISDMSIDYNDEIISIEDVGDKETIDITVTGDNLFYCNDILTKNSVGLPFTLDAFFALISTEELESMGQLMVKQLKNRWGDLNYYRRFVIGIDRSKMRLYNLENSAQSNIKQENNSTFDKSSFGEGMKSEKKKHFDIGDIS
jgi:hypothetical protein